MTAYADYLRNKLTRQPPTGLATVPELHASLFPHQRDLTSWALRRGRAAVFAGTGTGKSAVELEWSRCVAAHTSGRVLMLTPLAVAPQMAEEGKRLGLDVPVVRDGSERRDAPIVVTNYDRLHKFDAADFAGVVLDESGILKALDGKTRQALTESCRYTPFRLCATATPSPNDHVELGNHAEFLGICTRSEMLAEFFVHDGGETQTWRLKKHAVAAFWRWVASWGAHVRHPRDLGYDTARYDLPPLDIRYQIVKADEKAVLGSGLLFQLPARSLSEQRSAKRGSLDSRVAAVVDLVNVEPTEPWVLWAELNAEQDALADALGTRCVSIAGSDDRDEKIEKHRQWITGEVPVLASKVSVFGYGMNWQHCARMAFVGATYSFEGFYQAVRRVHRFGQRRPVRVTVMCGELETAMLDALRRKEAAFNEMGEALGAEAIEAVRAEVLGAKRQSNTYEPMEAMRLPSWLTEEAM